MQSDSAATNSSRGIMANGVDSFVWRFFFHRSEAQEFTNILAGVGCCVSYSINQKPRWPIVTELYYVMRLDGKMVIPGK